MKRTAQKKPKTFRILIRRIPNSRKAEKGGNSEPTARGKGEKQENHSPFFFGW